MAPTLVPEAGDLIEIFRRFFKHWAVYVGDGFVVHLTGTSMALSGSSPGSSRTSCGDEMAVVKKEKLSDVVGTDEWKINNILDNKYKPRPAHVIVKEACAMVGDELLYKLLKENCEHFATELRYGKAESRQVIKAGMALLVIGGFLVGEAGAAGVLGAACLVVGAPVVLAGVAGAAGVAGLGKWLRRRR